MFVNDFIIHVSREIVSVNFDEMDRRTDNYHYYILSLLTLHNNALPLAKKKKKIVFDQTQVFERV